MALFGQGDEKNYILEQLYVLLNAGMDVSMAMETLATEVQNEKLQKSLWKVKEKIDGGSQLWAAFSGTNIIPEQFLTFIKTGEQSGKLKEQLKMVSEQYTRDREFRSKLVSASIYPVFILIVVFVLGGVNAIIILPKITESFSKLGTQLPWITVQLLALGVFMKDYGLIALPTTLLVIILVVYFLFYFKKTKHIGQELLLRTPGIKNVLMQVELARFGFVFGLLVNSGITIIDALRFLESYTSTRRFQKFYLYLADGIENGQSFLTLFSTYPQITRVFPRSVQNLMTSAEKSGHMPETLLQIGEIYKKQLDVSTQTLSAVIEPLLIVVVWFFVLIVALAIIFPLYSIMGNISSY